MTDVEFRTRNAIFQLTRYGNGVETLELCDLLDAVADINDDMAHGRAPECVRESIDKAILILTMMKGATL